MERFPRHFVRHDRYNRLRSKMDMESNPSLNEGPVVANLVYDQQGLYKSADFLQSNYLARPNGGRNKGYRSNVSSDRSGFDINFCGDMNMQNGRDSHFNQSLTARRFYRRLQKGSANGRSDDINSDTSGIESGAHDDGTKSRLATMINENHQNADVILHNGNAYMNELHCRLGVATRPEQPTQQFGVPDEVDELMSMTQESNLPWKRALKRPRKWCGTVRKRGTNNKNGRNSHSDFSTSGQSNNQSIYDHQYTKNMYDFPHGSAGGYLFNNKNGNQSNYRHSYIQYKQHGAESMETQTGYYYGSSDPSQSNEYDYNSYDASNPNGHSNDFDVNCNSNSDNNNNNKYIYKNNSNNNYNNNYNIHYNHPNANFHNNNNHDNNNNMSINYMQSNKRNKKIHQLFKATTNDAQQTYFDPSEQDTQQNTFYENVPSQNYLPSYLNSTPVLNHNVTIDETEAGELGNTENFDDSKFQDSEMCSNESRGAVSNATSEEVKLAELRTTLEKQEQQGASETSGPGQSSETIDQSGSLIGPRAKPKKLPTTSRAKVSYQPRRMSRRRPANAVLRTTYSESSSLTLSATEPLAFMMDGIGIDEILSMILGKVNNRVIRQLAIFLVFICIFFFKNGRKFFYFCVLPLFYIGIFFLAYCSCQSVCSESSENLIQEVPV